MSNTDAVKFAAHCSGLHDVPRVNRVRMLLIGLHNAFVHSGFNSTPFHYFAAIIYPTQPAHDLVPPVVFSPADGLCRPA